MDIESFVLANSFTTQEVAKVTSGIQSVTNTGSQLIFTMNDNSMITVTIVGLSDNNYSTSEKNKLSSIDSTLLNRFTYINNQLLFNGLPIANSTIDLSPYLKTVDADNKYEAKDASIVKDSNYIHTDNNYTTSDQTKLLNIDTTKIDGAYTHISDINNPHQTGISNLKDINVISPTDKQVLGYDLATSKWVNQTVSGTDEKVKLISSSTSSDYLGNLIDNSTIQISNNKIVAKSLDGQTVTLTELNYISGLNENIMTKFASFGNGGIEVYKTQTFPTYANLLAFDFTTLASGKTYLMYVSADEGHSNNGTTYLVDLTTNNTTNLPKYSGLSSATQRILSVDKVDLTSEVKNQLPQANMDLTGVAKTTDLASYLTSTDASNTYATITQVSSKANISDVYTQIQTDSLLSNKSNLGHGHNISDVANLQTSLDSKLTVNDIVAGNNITLTKVGNTTTINSTATGGTGGISTWNTFNL